MKPSATQSLPPSDPIADPKEQLHFGAQSKRDSSMLVNESHEHAKLEDFTKDHK